VKKGIFILLTIILSTFILSACNSNKMPLRKGGRSGYPVGHDMNPNTKPDPDDLDTGGFS